MLGELQMQDDGTFLDKVEVSIRRLKAFEPKDGYYVAFSGGKDSQCVYHLCKMAGVKFDAHFTITSVDPPELVRFIRTNYPDVEMMIPHDKGGKPVTMWSLIASHTLPPTRKVRYCCASLKEPGGVGRVVVTGVRRAESANRKQTHGVVNFIGKQKGTAKTADELGANYKLNKHGNVIMNDDNDENRRMVEVCFRTRKTLVNPIVDWTDDEVWEFLNERAKVPHCCLYDEGFTRIGCIGCPLAGSRNMLRDFERWPKYKELYIRAFQKMIDNHPRQIRVLQPEYREKQIEFAKAIGEGFIDIEGEANSPNPAERAGGGTATLAQNAQNVTSLQEHSFSDGSKQGQSDTPPMVEAGVQAGERSTVGRVVDQRREQALNDLFSAAIRPGSTETSPDRQNAASPSGRIVTGSPPPRQDVGERMVRLVDGVQMIPWTPQDYFQWWTEHDL